MSNIVNAYQIPSSSIEEVRKPIEDGDGFKVIGPNDFPTFLPQSFRTKCDSAVRIVSGSQGENPVIMYNFHRIDGSEIDQHPFGTFLISGSIAVSSSFLDHGDWKGRTTKITRKHKEEIRQSGIGNYFVTYPEEGLASGSLDQLSKSNEKALNQFLSSVYNSPHKK